MAFSLYQNVLIMEKLGNNNLKLGKIYDTHISITPNKIGVYSQ
ncbi:hypothetical protein SAMN04489723_11152 [Algoriphagus aquimarinus]|uniref:Uncharacterized protein n=1 Tax=Algoriphagus aquimarinus TaxID=237018 RepID=A0A1I1BBC3_9BACT|nr:hypothetical protein SAMN04489723_11152 [Algoriphagus aquimarinus]